MVELGVDKSRIPPIVTHFRSLSNVSLDLMDVFKFGVLKQEVPPDRVEDTDYLYMQSKVPAYHSMFGDFIQFKDGSIVNRATDDRMMKDVSELVGIAVGVCTAITAFGVRQEDISRIPPPSGKVKYLDYRFPHGGQTIEMETKGTTSENVTRQVTDIAKKKKAATKPAFRFGAVTVLRKSSDSHRSKVHICDDPPEEAVSAEPEARIPWHYMAVLAHVTDNRIYNVIRKRWGKEGAAFEGPPTTNVEQAFFGRYKIGSDVYFGEFFDYRLNRANVAEAISSDQEALELVFERLTRNHGRVKLFMGIHETVAHAVMSGGSLAEISRLDFPRQRQVRRGDITQFIDSDGIIIIVATDHRDEQVESQFDEDEVKRRLRMFMALERQDPPECGAPCRSRDIEGKPCEIKTYLGTCHFHR